MPAKKQNCRAGMIVSVHRRGFTLLEMLMVVGVIGVLLAILLPAVQAAREAVRRTQCKNNLKQLGLGLIQYHELRGRFPPSIQFEQAKPDLTQYPDNPLNYERNWAVLVLPFIDSQTVYDSFNLSEPTQHPVNEKGRSTELAVMLCPSDTGQEVKFGDDFRQWNWARGNYGANGCIGRAYRYYPADNMPKPPYTMPCGGADQPFWKDPLTRGVMGANVSLATRQITDGASKTILLLELRVGLAQVDRRGTWAMGLPGASSLWGHALAGYGPNPAAGDNIGRCEQIVGMVGMPRLEREYMICGALGDSSTAAAATRSQHAGGVQVCMADGSVHFISDTIDRGDLAVDADGKINPAGMGTWQRLNAYADSLPLDASVLED